MSKNATIVSVFVFGLSGCSFPARVSRIELELHAPSIPSVLSGPIDSTLPAFGRVGFAQVAAGDNERTAVVWIREVDRSKLQWDEQSGLWRVEGSDLTLVPRRATEIPESSGLGPLKPTEKDLYGVGTYIGMSIIGPNGVEGSEFLPGVAADSCYSRSVVKGLAYVDSLWQLSLCLWPSGETMNRPSTHGVALVQFDASGWRKPAMVLPMHSGEPNWLFPQKDHTDLFYLKDYHHSEDLPTFMGGKQRERIDYVRIKQGATENTQTVYERPRAGGGVYEREQQVIPLGIGQYDLALARSTRMKKAGVEQLDLVHVPDLLGTYSGRITLFETYTVFGRCASTSRMVAIPLSGDTMQVVWLEQANSDTDVHSSKTIRLMEASYTGKYWLKPHVICESKGDYRSLAVSSFKANGKQRVIALWKGVAGSLTYVVGSGQGWTDATASALSIGKRNWLAALQHRVLLVTEVEGNLFWCHLGL